MKTIRDSIHGNIELNPLELAIIDTPEMQRLRYVRQLSLAYLVYPSALHTRFEHSLGTFQLTKSLSGRIVADKDEQQLLRLLALLHDVGHSAFSHLPEELIRSKTKMDHEKAGEEKMLSGNIGLVLRKYGVDPKELQKTLTGRSGKIITSELGTDRMDYLLRDAYFTGVAYSLIDAQRLLLSLSFHKNRLVLEEKGILAAESLLVSRYLMFNAVYNHHAVRIAASMLSKGLEKALLDRKIHLLELTDGMDDVVLYKLREEPLIERILSRNLFKAAIELPNFEIEGKASLLDRIDDEMRGHFDDSEYVICPPKQQMGDIDMPVLFEDGKLKEFNSISKISSAVAMQRRALGLVVATSKEKTQKARKLLLKIVE